MIVGRFDNVQDVEDPREERHDSSYICLDICLVAVETCLNHAFIEADHLPAGTSNSDPTSAVCEQLHHYSSASSLNPNSE
jgi:hypothetical protein